MSEEKNAVLITQDGLEGLKKELAHLKVDGRKDIAQKIHLASEFGDLSENAEYDEAKNEQALLEARIIQLENMIKNAKIISADHSKNMVSVGSTILLYNGADQSESEYTIVGAVEADPLNGKISNESPVGKAIIGQKEGAKCLVKAPSGMIEYIVKKIKA